MPELPEVETLRRALVPLVEGKTLKEIRFFRDNLRFPIPVKVLEKQVVDRKIEAVRRKGKYLLFHNSSGTMILHLGMSGRLKFFNKKNYTNEKHDHVVMEFSQFNVVFNDPRRFGMFFMLEDDQELNNFFQQYIESHV